MYTKGNRNYLSPCATTAARVVVHIIVPELSLSPANKAVTDAVLSSFVIFIFLFPSEAPQGLS